MSRVSNFARLLCIFVLAARVHAANIPPPPVDPDRRPTRYPPITDPIPTTCSTSTVSIGCGNNACQSAWATAFTSSNDYVQSFCSSFTSPGRKNTLKFDKKGPASACTKGLGNAAIQSSISSVCSCYAGPGVPTRAFIAICPTCPPIATQTVTTSIPTTIVRTLSRSIKTITTVITLVIDPPPPIRTTTTTTTTTHTITTTRPGLGSAPCTTTNVLTTTQVTAIYDYFTYLTTYLTTTTYQAGRYPCATTICTPQPATTITIVTPYCNQISERVVTATVTSTVTAGLPFLPPSSQTCDPATTTTVTLVIDPSPIVYTVTETVSIGECASIARSTFSPIIIDDGGLTFNPDLLPKSTTTSK
ncbi:hypothetical protein EYC80_005325 [Monilinia laxa]|uniref:Uncharacterized protein n=1 Tax=Monilinia laxa TaxID=61186 RepID=A0A5N6KJJ5_MONLA|nr:hypothetical protein EYC80_005325 [Monilinia laxa]